MKDAARTPIASKAIVFASLVSLEMVISASVSSMRNIARLMLHFNRNFPLFVERATDA